MQPARALSHLTLRDSQWGVNLGPACGHHTWTAPCLQSSYIALDLDVDIVDSYIAMDVDLSDLGVCKPNVRIC